MIYLELFLGFLKVGLFAFGGAYAAIPVIREVVLSYGWIDDEMLTYMRTRMPSYMIPTRLFYVPEFQLNMNGKIDKNILKSLIK